MVCSDLGRPTSLRYEEEDHAEAIQRLQSDGVHVSRTGQVAFTEIEAQGYEHGSWSSDMPAKELLGFTPASTDP
eukprot:10641312-Karenia_brevis.AAC.1